MPANISSFNCQTVAEWAESQKNRGIAD